MSISDYIFLKFMITIFAFSLSFPVYTQPNHERMLTSYDLFLSHHELIMRYCVDGVNFSTDNFQRTRCVILIIRVLSDCP